MIDLLVVDEDFKIARQQRSDDCDLAELVKFARPDDDPPLMSSEEIVGSTRLPGTIRQSPAVTASPTVRRAVAPRSVPRSPTPSASRRSGRRLPSSGRRVAHRCLGLLTPCYADNQDGTQQGGLRPFP